MPFSRDRALRLLEAVAVAASLLAISAAYFHAAIQAASSTHLWMDEILAVQAARQPTVGGVWRFIWAGTDFSPPTYHLLLHFLSETFGPAGLGLVGEPLFWRLPSIAAVFGAAAYAYLLARRHLAPLVSVLPFGLVLSLGLFNYAIQARQYALLAFCFAAALLLWSGMDRSRHPKLRAFALWAAMAGCLLLHFFGAVEVAAVGVAELAYAASYRRIRLPVWGALLMTAPVEALLAPIAVHLAQFNAGDKLSTGFYARPTPSRFIAAVLDVLGGDTLGTMLLLWGSLVFLLVTVALKMRGRTAAPAQEEPPSGPSMLDLAVVALCALPPLTFGFALAVTGTFSSRYMVAAVLLPALAAPLMLNRSPSRRIVALALIPLLAAMAAKRGNVPDTLGDALAVIRSADLAPLPVVVGTGLLYIELMEGAPADLKEHLVFLLTPEGLPNPDATDENEIRRMLALRPDYRVSGQAEFLRANPKFYVLARPDAAAGTTVPSLVGQGLIAAPLKTGGGIEVFRGSAQAGG